MVTPALAKTVINTPTTANAIKSSKPLKSAPSDASIRQLMEVTHSEAELANALVDSIVSDIANFDYGNQVDLGKATPEQIKQVNNIVKRYVEQIVKSIVESPKTQQQLEDSFITNAKKYYSQEDVNMLLEFFGSGVADRYEDMSFAYAKEYGAKLGNEYKAEMSKVAPKIITEVQAVFKK